MTSFSVMGKLPATSYVRLEDIWLIFGQLMPFIQVFISTYIHIIKDMGLLIYYVMWWWQRVVMGLPVMGLFDHVLILVV